MIEKLDRSRVNGFLQAKGTAIVNEKGEEILLYGWGLGNWLLNEGYMWRAGKNFDRSRKMEATIRKLAGDAYADTFWKRFRDIYVSQTDIRYMAQLGCNSVRIPINWRLFLEDKPGLHFKDAGFFLLDRCIDWCEKYKIYAFIDMHGAPGGQTGTNIDDSADDFPHLFDDADSWDKAIGLWTEIARRYAGRWIVGGYDLLNEPLHTPDRNGDVDYLVPKLALFYKEACAAIRKVDNRHLLSLEGHHWSTRLEVFDQKYDENMLLHFHRYWCVPDISSYQPYLDRAKALDCPLWLGESGENELTWFSAMYPLALSLGIGINIWPWKKIGDENAPLTIQKPENWDLFIDSVNGEPLLAPSETRQILDEYLENCKFENCIKHPKVTAAVLRRPNCVVRATDFDALPKQLACSGKRTESSPYRLGCGMKIVLDPAPFDPIKAEKSFNCYLLEMETGEFACYSIYDLHEKDRVSFSLFPLTDTDVLVFQNETLLSKQHFAPTGQPQLSKPMFLSAAAESVVKIEVASGAARFDTLSFHAAKHRC